MPRVVNGGWIKLHRSILKWGWYDDMVVSRVFLHLLLIANYEETEYHGHKIGVGQAVIGLHKLSEDLGLSVRQIRTALDKLKSTSEITIKSTNRFSIVTIENYTKFQCCGDDFDKQNDKQTDKQMTNNRQTDDKQPTTYKEIKKERIKENKNILIEKESIEGLLADDEILKLQEMIPLYDGFMHFAEKQIRISKANPTNLFNYLVGLAEHGDWIEKGTS